MATTRWISLSAAGVRLAFIACTTRRSFMTVSAEMTTVWARPCDRHPQLSSPRASRMQKRQGSPGVSVMTQCYSCSGRCAVPVSLEQSVAEARKALRFTGINCDRKTSGGDLDCPIFSSIRTRSLEAENTRQDSDLSWRQSWAGSCRGASDGFHGSVRATCSPCRSGCSHAA